MHRETFKYIVGNLNAMNRYNNRYNVSFVLIVFVLLFVVISSIFVVFELHRFAFVAELVVLLVIISLIAFGMFLVGNRHKWGWILIGATLVLWLINITFIYFLTRKFETAHIAAVIFSLIGIVISALNQRKSASELGGLSVRENEKSNYYPYIDKMEPEQKMPGEGNAIEKTFTPGKYIASKQANKFHSPKCDWARRITKSNQLWFGTRQEAEVKGYQADKCVA